VESAKQIKATSLFPQVIMISAYVSPMDDEYIINSDYRPDGFKAFQVQNDWVIPEGFKTGLVERDLELHPVGSSPESLRADQFFNKDIPIIEPEYWTELIEEKDRKKTGLDDLRMISGLNGNPMESYDQNGDGYCWAYSTGAAITLRRAEMGLPYIRLSCHSVAAREKKGRDEGGWCGLSGLRATQWGYAPVSYKGKTYWPEKSRDLRYDTEETREMAKNFRITEGFLDLAEKPYEMSLTFKQIVSCLLSNIPCALDFMWMSHSMCGIAVKRISNKYELADMRSWGIKCWNSWRDSFGKRGTGVICGPKCVPDGAIGVRDVVPFE